MILAFLDMPMERERGEPKGRQSPLSSAPIPVFVGIGVITCCRFLDSGVTTLLTHDKEEVTYKPLGDEDQEKTSLLGWRRVYDAGA